MLSNEKFAHPAMSNIARNLSMVELLLYRHGKNHGGVLLPPMAPANKVLQEYEVTVAQAREAYAARTGQILQRTSEQCPIITFSKWSVDTSSPRSDIKLTQCTGKVSELQLASRYFSWPLGL